MKKILISGGILIFFSILTSAQTAIDILKKSYEKCQSIKNGYYEADRHFKSMTKKDTSLNSFQCYFNKLENDTLFSSAFHYKSFYKGKYLGDVLYTGNDFATTNAKDSTATIRSKAMWADDIKQIRHNYKFYSPLTNKESKPLPVDSNFIDKNYHFELLGDDLVNNTLCYHIQQDVAPEPDTTEPMKVLRIEHHYWINKVDFIPVQYSIRYDLLMNNDTMQQYEKNVLQKYELNNQHDDAILTLASIPPYYKSKDYVPYKSPEPLPEDTIAPNWKLVSLKGEEISLSDLKGKLVLIDFFYKSCYPCMQALPALQALHEKYDEKGLRVVGINPFDTKEDDLEAFLAKRGVTYTVVLEGKDAANTYRVSGYPTLFLVDKNGKIIFMQVGYGQDSEKEIEERIVQNL